MKIWGVAISLLGIATVLLLGFIAIQMLQKPEAVSPDQPQPKPQVVEIAPAGDDRLELQRIELERERLAVETLRLKAQIQAELSKIESALREEAEAGAPVADPGAVVVADEARVEAEVAPPSMQNFEPDPIAYSDFRAPLEPFGDWSESADYGPVWSPAPAFADDGWAPYTHGSWGYSDYGWSWASDEPFAWACYHYGRWIRLVGHGWCWVPGRDWAPAWVAWRTCDTHVAWAPLPPCARWNRQLGISDWVDAYCGIGPESYCFVERRDFGAADCRRVILPRGKNYELVGRSKNVTRLERAERFVRNGGPEFGHSSKLSTRPIPRLKIDPEADSESLRKRIAAVGAAGSSKHPPLKKLALAQPDRGWGNGAGDEHLRLRKQVVSEARGALAAGVGEVAAVKSKGRARDGDPAPRAVPTVIAKSPSKLSPRAGDAFSDRGSDKQLAAEEQRAQPEIRAKGIARAEAEARKVTADAAAGRDAMREVQARAADEERAARLARTEAETKTRREQEERAARLERAEAESKHRREQQEEQEEQATMLARKQAEEREQAARQAEDRERQTKVREQQERAAAAQAKQNRERQMIAENESRARAEAQREAMERQARAAAEEAQERQRRAAAEQDAKRRMDEQNRRAAVARAKDQQDRREQAEANRRRQEQAARDRQAAEARQHEQAKRDAQARENQQRQAAAEEASRRKQAEDAREHQAQQQREQQKQRDQDAARDRERAAGGGSKFRGR